jgi:hypothetical protein
MFGPSWEKGDTVGCGVTQEGQVFFTLNGRWIAEAPHNISEDLIVCYRDSIYGAFSSSAPCKVAFKFNDFKYQLFKGSSAPFLIERALVPQYENFCMGYRSDTQTLDLPVIIDSHVIEFSENITAGQALQSNIPITYLQPGNLARQRGFYYFEVVIENYPAVQWSVFSLGLAVKPYPFLHHIGCNKDSLS